MPAHRFLARAGCGLSATAAAVVLASSLSSCRGDHWRQTELLHANAGLAVYREQFVDSETGVVAQAYAHPVNVTPEELGVLFTRLRVSEDRLLGDAEEARLLHRVQAAELAAALSDALARVGPDERVRFLSCQDERFLGVFRSLTCSSGVVFASEPGRLEVAFDAIHERPDAEDGNLRTVRFHRRPTEITESGVRLIVPEGVSRRRDEASGQKLPLWISVELEELARQANQLEEEQAAERLAIEAVEEKVQAQAEAQAQAREATRSAAEATTSDTAVSGAARDDELAPQAAVPRRVALFRGCTVYELDGEYYALPPGSEPLDAQRLSAGEYDLVFVASSIEEIIARLRAAEASGLFAQEDPQEDPQEDHEE
jgi:hypothetical protein